MKRYSYDIEDDNINLSVNYQETAGGFELTGSVQDTDSGTIVPFFIKADPNGVIDFDIKGYNGKITISNDGKVVEAFVEGLGAGMIEGEGKNNLRVLDSEYGFSWQILGDGLNRSVIKFEIA